MICVMFFFWVSVCGFVPVWDINQWAGATGQALCKLWMAGYKLKECSARSSVMAKDMYTRTCQLTS
jgi:hypothetical protein